MDCSHDREHDQWLLDERLLPSGDLSDHYWTAQRCRDRALELGRGAFTIFWFDGFEGEFVEVALTLSSGDRFYLTTNTYGVFSPPEFPSPLNRYYCGTSISDEQSGCQGEEQWRDSFCYSEELLAAEVSDICREPVQCSAKPDPFMAGPAGTRCASSADCNSGLPCTLSLEGGGVCATECEAGTCAAGTECVSGLTLATGEEAEASFCLVPCLDNADCEPLGSQCEAHPDSDQRYCL